MAEPIVLIVEDEALIRMNASEMIQEAGFEVVEAVHADEAIAILERRNDIRAVFTDINMPGSMDGWKLAHAIRGRWPPTHLIITSGKGIPAAAQLPVRGRFIAKPYGATEIAAVLRDLFGLEQEIGRTEQG